MGDLTAHFDRAEFLASDRRPDLAAKMSLTDFEVFKLWVLAVTILEPVREAIGRAMAITNGKRSGELLQALNALGYPTSATSDHLFRGFSVCCDFRFGDPESTMQAFLYIRAELPNAFGQLILYRGKNGEASHVHVSLPSPGNVGEVYEKPYGGKIVLVDPGRKVEGPTRPSLGDLA